MLTKAQLLAVDIAIGDGSHCPQFTTDPMVNCEVDHMVLGDPCWDDLPQSLRNMYREEVDYWRKGR